MLYFDLIQKIAIQTSMFSDYEDGGLVVFCKEELNKIDSTNLKGKDTIEKR